MRITAAAVRLNGKIYQGLRYGLVMQQIWEELGPVHIYDHDQGFVSEDGRFWNRFQAGSIAFRAGQTKTRKRHLLSEDLW